MRTEDFQNCRVNIKELHGKLPPHSFVITDLGDIEKLRYIGDLSFEFEISGQRYEAGVETEIDWVMGQAGLLRISVPGFGWCERLYCLDVRLIAVLFDCGLRRSTDGMRDSQKSIWNPGAIPPGTAIKCPEARKVWCKLGAKYQFGLNDKDIRLLRENLICVDVLGNVLYDPHAQFQSHQFRRAEDVLLALIWKSTPCAVGMVKSGRVLHMLDHHECWVDGRNLAHREFSQFAASALGFDFHG